MKVTPERSIRTLEPPASITASEARSSNGSAAARSISPCAKSPSAVLARPQVSGMAQARSSPPLRGTQGSQVTRLTKMRRWPEKGLSSRSDGRLRNLPARRRFRVRLSGAHPSSRHILPSRQASPDPKVGLVGALDRASGRHRHAAVDPARCPTDPRDAPSRTRAVPSEPDLVPAGLAAVAMDRRAAEDDPIPGTGPGCGGAVLLLHPAARVGLARLAGVRAHPVEPGVRARTGTERRFVRRRPVLQRIVVVHPRDRVGRRDRLDTSDRGHRGGKRPPAVLSGDRVLTTYVHSYQSPR